MAAELHAALATTGYSGAIRIVQWCVIALVFLFFLRVVRAVWVEVRPAGPRQARSNSRPQADRPAEEAPVPRNAVALHLEVVEPADVAGQRFDIGEELTIGRSPGCGISTSYDIYSSTLHAKLFPENGRVYVEDLGSTNGTFVNSERIVKPVRLGRGDLLQVGATVFQVKR
ncbi:MAG: FHA domain-containing protein [Acidimicrobiales bacterium]